jgi:hypothetical protein
VKEYEGRKEGKKERKHMKEGGNRREKGNKEGRQEARHMKEGRKETNTFSYGNLSSYFFVLPSFLPSFLTPQQSPSNQYYHHRHHYNHHHHCHCHPEPICLYTYK